MDVYRAREVIGWSYGACPLDADVASFGPFRGLVDLWSRRRLEGAALPLRAAFDIADVRPWLGRVAIARIERSPFQVRFVLWGTELTQWWGVDYTNKVVGELSQSPAAWADVEIAYFREMDRDPFIGVVHGSLRDHERSYHRVLGIDLPMGLGRQLTHVLSAHMEIEDETAVPDPFQGFPIERKI